MFEVEPVEEQIETARRADLAKVKRTDVVAASEVGESRHKHRRAADFVGLHGASQAVDDGRTVRRQHGEKVLDDRGAGCAADAGVVARKLRCSTGKYLAVGRTQKTQRDCVAGGPQREILRQVVHDAARGEVLRKAFENRDVDLRPEIGRCESLHQHGIVQIQFRLRHLVPPLRNVVQMIGHWGSWSCQH